MTIGMIDQGFHRFIVRRYAFVSGNRRGFPELFYLVYPYSPGGALQNFVLKRRSITIIPMLLNRVFHFYFRFSLKFHPVFTGENVRRGDIYFHPFFPVGSARNENSYRGNVYGSDVYHTDVRHVHLHPLLGEGGEILLYHAAFACFTHHSRVVIHDRTPLHGGDEIDEALAPKAQRYESISLFLPSYLRGFADNFTIERGMWANVISAFTMDSRAALEAGYSSIAERFEIRISKFETNPNYQNSNSNDRKQAGIKKIKGLKGLPGFFYGLPLTGLSLNFEHWNFQISRPYRGPVPDFGFRALDLPDTFLSRRSRGNSTIGTRPEFRVLPKEFARYFGTSSPALARQSQLVTHDRIHDRIHNSTPPPGDVNISITLPKGRKGILEFLSSPLRDLVENFMTVRRILENTRFVPVTNFQSAVGTDHVFARHLETALSLFSSYFEPASPVFSRPGFWRPGERKSTNTYVSDLKQLNFQIGRQYRGGVPNFGIHASDLFFLSFFRHLRYNTTGRPYSSPGIFQQPSLRWQPWGGPLHGIQEFFNVTHAGAGHALYSHSRPGLSPFPFRPMGKSEERNPKFETNSNDQNKEQFTGHRISFVLNFEHLNFRHLSDYGFRASDLSYLSFFHHSSHDNPRFDFMSARSVPLPQLEYFHPAGTLQREIKTSLAQMGKSAVPTGEEETLRVDHFNHINKTAGSVIPSGWGLRNSGVSHQQRQTNVNIDELTDRVYRTLEKKIKMEREMRGW